VSQIGTGRRYADVNATDLSAASEAVGSVGAEAPFDFEATFRAQYERIARVIRRVVHDSARAEELAVEVFLKLWRSPEAQGEKAAAWLYRSAVRKGLDELRRRTRRTRYESFFGFVRAVPTPEDIRAAAEGQERVRLVLAVIQQRHAELLLLRSQDLSYDELASALDLNPASIGTLLRRAQQAFRKEYIKRYGEQ
jgi:RNA polymerase sigma-70 factor (ECF subfamily)